MSLKQKAKTLSDLFWENELEWSKWLRMGVTENKAIKLSPKYHEKWTRLVDAEEEIKRVDDKLQGKLAKAILKYQGYKKKIAKLKEKADYYNKMYGKLASERDSLKDRLGQIREHIKNLFDTIPIEMEKVGRKYEVYSIGTKKQWIEWFIKYDDLMGLLAQNLEKPEPKKKEKAE